MADEHRAASLADLLVISLQAREDTERVGHGVAAKSDGIALAGVLLGLSALHGISGGGTRGLRKHRRSVQCNEQRDQSGLCPSHHLPFAGCGIFEQENYRSTAIMTKLRLEIMRCLNLGR
ncbi:MAG TPA: hypothetical protein VNR11_01450 [Xanthobacteraceae bacterium]|nr:hypothetical protein [Xanthobacteraceae bacterium]